jgi:hypothetical protein
MCYPSNTSTLTVVDHIHIHYIIISSNLSDTHWMCCDDFHSDQAKWYVAGDAGRAIEHAQRFLDEKHRVLRWKPGNSLLSMGRLSFHADH